MHRLTQTVLGVALGLLWAGCAQVDASEAPEGPSSAQDAAATEAQDGCAQPNPAVGPCRGHGDCPQDQECVLQAEACAPSACECDAASGAWRCTEDCLPSFACVAAQGDCAGANPALPACRDDADCPGTQRCVPDDTICVPSTCSCDELSSTWSCTEDCGPGFVCRPERPGCEEDDPAAQACQIDADCPGTQRCVQDNSACVPSECHCDAPSGGWVCTADCGPAFVCTSAEGSCAGENPAEQVCQIDADCPGTERCVHDDSVCVPSECSCDAQSGDWVCTADCEPAAACAPEVSACEGPNPAAQECQGDGDCAGERRCVQDDSACVPSACSCDEPSGTWLCARDCVPRSTCGPVVFNCVGPNPAQQECQESADCDRELRCVELAGSDECVPEACSCGAQGWICTAECGPRRVCKREEFELACLGENPTFDLCRGDDDCPGDRRCRPEPRGCTPSTCTCNGQTGQWDCSQDCRITARQVCVDLLAVEEREAAHPPEAQP